MDRPRPSQRPWIILGLILFGCTACNPSGAPAEGASTGSAALTDAGSAAASGPSGGVGDTGGPQAGNGDGVTAQIQVGAARLLSEELARIQGRRVGLVTNQTGIIRVPGGATVSTIDALYENPQVELVALFSPEHGIRGTAEAGVEVASGRDAGTGLPVYSLYGDTRRPTPEMLEGVDVLLFDMQDVGARYYTYVSTLAYVMEAAGDAGIPVVVLDRPNPIGGDQVQGNVLDPEFSSFVGLYPVPMRHGMTVGELARMYVGEFGVEVELQVVPMAGWRREMGFSDTGLPWLAPSPNMPDEVSALHYPGTCLFEGTVLSVARGTDRPFQQVGAPGLNANALVRALRRYDFPDVSFEAVTFTPVAPGDGKFGGEEVSGVRFEATGPAYDPTRVSVATLVEAARLLGAEWSWTGTMDRLAGTDALRTGVDAGASYDELTAGWDAALAEFRERRGRYLLY